jgi:DNA-binding GntR family transcriptional regulator
LLRPLVLSSDQPIEQEIRLHLRREIMSGAVPPSAQFSVRGIAEALNVGLTPTRVALKGLETEGILQSSPRRNFLVNVPDIQAFNEILLIREKLESVAAVAAVDNLSEPDMDDISRLCEAMEDRSVDPFDALRLNYDFHFSIYRRSEMGFLLSLIEIAWLRVGPLFHLLGGDFNRGEGFRNHRRIVAALKARDREAVRISIQTDLVDGAEPIREKLRLILR